MRRTKPIWSALIRSTAQPQFSWVTPDAFRGKHGDYSGCLLRIAAHSLSLLSETDSASIIPEIGFGDVGAPRTYACICTWTTIETEKHRQPCDLRASSSYGDSKQQPGPNGACKFASCRDTASGTMMGPLSDSKLTFIVGECAGVIIQSQLFRPFCVGNQVVNIHSIDFNCSQLYVSIFIFVCVPSLKI